MYVTKRNGSTEPLIVEKIRKVLRFACQDMPDYVSDGEIESRLSVKLRDGITTEEIQKSCYLTASELCTPEKPSYRYVAGRLLLYGYKKQTIIDRGYGYFVASSDGKNRQLPQYFFHVKSMISKGLYSDEILSNYTDEELVEAGNWIIPERDEDYDYAGAILLVERYTLCDELPQEAFLTCALLLASVEKPENRLKKAKEIYDAVSLRKISLATPMLANLRVPNSSLSSCFILSIEDNLDSIYDELKNAARISKSGGGLGVNVSAIRATGSWVNGRADSSGGVIPWVKLLNDTAVSVNQGGRRPGAFTVALDTWHLDIEEFLAMRSNVGDERRKAHDIFTQVVCSDEFMRRVKNDEMWTLIDPYEIKQIYGKDIHLLYGYDFEMLYEQIENDINVKKGVTLYKRIKARDLFKEILKSLTEKGVPYIAFKDAINRANPNPFYGIIPNVNLCCVSGDTMILTRNGEFRIDQLAGTIQDVWNGEEWSSSPIFQTNENQPLYRVDFSNGCYVECTEYHRFPIVNDSPLFFNTSFNELHYEMIKTIDLSVGDLLIEYHNPVSQVDHQNVKVVNIRKLDDERPVYCLFEPKRNLAVFNDLILGNCESFSVVKPYEYIHVCNLASLNAANIEDNEWEQYCALCVNILDNAISLTVPPIEEARVHNEKFRTIGVGVMGLADWLAFHELRYSDYNAISKLFEDISYYTIKESIRLAKERGTFEAYSDSTWASGLLMNCRSLVEVCHDSYDPDRWVDLHTDLYLYGIRNSHLMMIAPNTSSSQIQGCTASIIPCYDWFYYEKSSKWTKPIAVQYIDTHRWYYDVNQRLDQRVLIGAVAEMQKWIDTGISMEFLFNYNPDTQVKGKVNAKVLYDTYIDAWKNGLKTVYYMRSVQEDKTKEKSECSACAN